SQGGLSRCGALEGGLAVQFVTPAHVRTRRCRPSLLYGASIGQAQHPFQFGTRRRSIHGLSEFTPSNRRSVRESGPSLARSPLALPLDPRRMLAASPALWNSSAAPSDSQRSDAFRGCHCEPGGPLRSTQSLDVVACVCSN